MGIRYYWRQDIEKVKIGQKEYTQEELYLIGKEHYPRYYYIFLYFGIIFFFPSLFVEFVIGVITIILYNVMEKDFPIWAFYIPLGVFGFFALTGLIFMIVAIFGRSKRRYIRYGYNYVMKKTENGQNDKVVPTENDEERQRKLERYNRLLKAGAMSQEEYDKNVSELE